MKAIMFLMIFSSVPAFAVDRNLASTSSVMSSYSGMEGQQTPNDAPCPNCILRKFGFSGYLTDQTVPKVNADGSVGNFNDLNQ